MGLFRKRLIKEIAILLGVVAFLALGIAFFGFNINKFAKKITETRRLLAERSLSIQSLSVLRSEYVGEAKQYLNVLYNVVPKKDELIDLSKDLGTLAQEDQLEYGFTFISETPATAVSLGSIRFSLSLGGSLDGLFNFLKNLENFRYLVNLENISLSKREDGMRMEVQAGIPFRQ